MLTERDLARLQSQKDMLESREQQLKPRNASAIPLERHERPQTCNTCARPLDTTPAQASNLNLNSSEFSEQRLFNRPASVSKQSPGPLVLSQHRSDQQYGSLMRQSTELNKKDVQRLEFNEIDKINVESKDVLGHQEID
mmetsp:Transcript_33050/g.40931  ORF Transcript_33050/g.40931 Transcript_33050/m.40931 type:complete len:139 (-) Transcript_33050:1241-1657(-)